MINETRARELQAEYLETRNERAFNALWQEVQGIAVSLLYSRIRNTQAFIDVEEKATDATNNFMGMYLKNDSWKCSAFAYRINCDVKDVLYNKKQKKIDAEINIPPNYKIIQQNIDDMYNFDINCDIIKEVERSNTFRVFIKRILIYTDREYIRRNVNRLNELYVSTKGAR